MGDDGGRVAALTASDDRYAAWLADGTPAGGWDSYRYTVLTYGHDRYTTEAKAKNAVRRIHKQRTEYAAYSRNHHTEVQ